MHVLLVHNRYQIRSGEDFVFDAEERLLKENGIQVSNIIVDNNDLDESARFMNGFNAIWSLKHYRNFNEKLLKIKPDVMHVHNILPQFSSSIFAAAKEVGIPTVQTLHNYRMVCPNALLYREGSECNLCTSKLIKWPGILHKCYRQSRAATLVVGLQTLIGRFTNNVDRFIALSEFAKSKFVEGGLAAEKIVVKSNFASDIGGPPETLATAKLGALYVGRISEEKGVRTLLKSWQELDHPLTIIGDGPLKNELERSCSQRINWHGRLNRDETMLALKSAAFLVFPSECYENFPLTIAEAFSAGIPVIAADIGSASEIVSQGETGFLYPAGDIEELKKYAQSAFDNPEKMLEMGRAARKKYEENYTPETNFEKLISIYEDVIEAA